MAPLEDHLYIKRCAELARYCSISLASARRKVELAAARDGVKDLNAKKDIAERLLIEARSRQSSGEEDASTQLDQLLTALAEEENFMVED